MLQSNALAYVQATEVGGTHPALVEAMGAGNAIVANDVPEHRETLGDAGLYYAGQTSSPFACKESLTIRSGLKRFGLRPASVPPPCIHGTLSPRRMSAGSSAHPTSLAIRVVGGHP